MNCFEKQRKQKNCTVFQSTQPRYPLFVTGYIILKLFRKRVL